LGGGEGEWLAGPAGRSQLREMFSHHAGGDPASPLRGSPLRDGTGAMVEAARGRDGVVGEELGVAKNGGAITISAPKDSGGADSRRQGSARAIQASQSGVAALSGEAHGGEAEGSGGAIATNQKRNNWGNRKGKSII